MTIDSLLFLFIIIIFFNLFCYQKKDIGLWLDVFLYIVMYTLLFSPLEYTNTFDPPPQPRLLGHQLPHAQKASLRKGSIHGEQSFNIRVYLPLIPQGNPGRIVGYEDALNLPLCFPLRHRHTSAGRSFSRIARLDLKFIDFLPQPPCRSTDTCLQHKVHPALFQMHSPMKAHIITFHSADTKQKIQNRKRGAKDSSLKKLHFHFDFEQEYLGLMSLATTHFD